MLSTLKGFARDALRSTQDTKTQDILSYTIGIDCPVKVFYDGFWKFSNTTPRWRERNLPNGQEHSQGPRRRWKRPLVIGWSARLHSMRQHSDHFQVHYPELSTHCEYCNIVFLLHVCLLQVLIAKILCEKSLPCPIKLNVCFSSANLLFFSLLSFL